MPQSLLPTAHSPFVVRLLKTGMLLAWVCGTGIVTAAEPAKSKSAAPAKTGTSLERVEVSKDGKTFVLAESGKRFTPWGFNYLGAFGRLAEEDWDTDWAKIETDFREMRKLGANVVRWHLQFGTYMKQADTPNAEELARLKRLLDLACDTGLYLDLTGLSCYHLDHIPDWYDGLSEADRWQAQARFWEAIAETCAGHPAVFCYDLINEPIIGEPKKGDLPWLGGELGGFYFVQRICNKPAGRDSKEIAEAWVKLLVDAIRKHDRETLVTVGVIPWAQIWPNAKPLFYSPQVVRHLDFISVHFYPKTGQGKETLAALAVYDVGKPLVVEEIFPLSCTLEELDQFIDGSHDRVEGWISHYFGHTIEEHNAGAEPGGGKIVAAFLEYWRKKGKALQE